MSAYFVTATGTDIGKTFVTAGLIRHLRNAGEEVDAFKPVVSGFDIATAALSDPGVLLGALDEAVTPESLDRLSPWRFAAPLSPDMAAAREGKSLDFDAIVSTCKKRIAQSEGTLFIEGVGGVMVPLDETHTVLDWMKALDLPLIVVTGSYLGTISHTLTAMECLSRKGLVVKALVINDSGDGAVPMEETKAALARFLPDVTLAALPRVKRPTDAADNFAALWRAIG
ncbi:MAG: dethiobiotin synthase [Proteobacteria bacterium]|nr:dethiobiotin synthase [Pseudomonadota bacterium]